MMHVNFRNFSRDWDIVFDVEKMAFSSEICIIKYILQLVIL